MTETPTSAEEPAPDEHAPGAERQTTPFLVLQFFIFPMAIVAVCVTVFVVFGLIASEGKGPRDYLQEVRAGSANRRWQAAFELSKVLQAGKHPALRDPEFVAQVAVLFDEAGNDDPRVRRYLAVALGRLGDRKGVPSLEKFVETAGPDTDVETLIYAVWALGSLGDPAAVPALVEASGSEERDVRKAAAHALGVFPGEEARAALVALLADAGEDVRWNAAVSLARRGDTAATPVLLQMLERDHLAKVEGVTHEQQEEALLQAVAVATELPDPDVKKALETLRDRDPSLKVRDAAREALKP